MKQKLLLFCLCLLIIAGCQENIEEPSTTVKGEAFAPDRDEMARYVVDLLNEDAVNPLILSTLRSNKTGTAMGALLRTVEATHFSSKATAALGAIVNHSEKALQGDVLPDNIEIPELWMYVPDKKFKAADILVAYPPAEGDEKDWTTIKAYTLNKQVVYLDAQTDPGVPVVVVETKGHEAFLLQVAYMNKVLRQHGLQHHNPLTSSSARQKSGGVDTSILKKVSLRDDEEPWIKGAAEIYAITSGIRNTDNEPEIKIIPMEYLDHDGKTYFPNQVLLFWDEYEYQAANILFYEQDTNYNYKQLTSILVQGVFDIVGPLTGQPWVAALGKITAAIMDAMPDDWYTDTDDYIDALYTIERTKGYYNHNGAAANLQADIEPYFIPANF